MSKRKKVFKIIILLCLIILSCSDMVLIIPFIKYLSTDEGRIYIQQKVESFGIFPSFVYTAGNNANNTCSYSKGGPVEMIGGVLFGAIGGLVYVK